VDIIITVLAPLSSGKGLGDRGKHNLIPIGTVKKINSKDKNIKT